MTKVTSMISLINQSIAWKVIACNQFKQDQKSQISYAQTSAEQAVWFSVAQLQKTLWPELVED